MKHLSGILASALFIVLFIFLVTISVPRDLPEKQIEESFRLYQGESITDIEERAAAIVDYVIGKTGTLKGMTYKETVHLKDVRNILLTLESIVILSLLYLAYLSFRDYDMIYIFSKGALFSLIFVVLLSIFVYFFFDPLFTLLHKILFTNNYWLLDPTKSSLVLLFPESYFYNIGILFIRNTIIVSLAILLSEKIYQKVHNVKEQ